MRRLFAPYAVAIATTVGGLIMGAAAGADWPAKPVRVIVAYAAGGANDLLGRVFAERLGDALGQQFFVENRTGGGGLIGTAAVARAEPDGYTLIVSGMPSHVLAPAMNKNAGFDPVRDFTHIAYLGGPPNVFAVHNSSPVKSFKELLALMRAQTDGLNTWPPRSTCGSHTSSIAAVVPRSSTSSPAT
jgi:tripartite-type tricarboxylate transporter receptor subunit TctC